MLFIFIRLEPKAQSPIHLLVQALDCLDNFALALRVDFSDLKGVRMTRWGHSLPVANTGLIKSGFLENMSRPFGGKIFFANQDNWANPAFECSFAAAKEATDKIRELIK